MNSHFDALKKRLNLVETNEGRLFLADKNRRLLMLCLSGSHLYGTNTETSDLDFKGVFLPNEKEFILGEAPEHLSFNTKNNSSEKNSSKDIDVELFSFNNFVKLVSSGQTVAIEMMFTPASKHGLIYMDYDFSLFVEYRDGFLTKRMNAFTGYAATQARKYSMKGNRLNTFKSVVDFLETVNQEQKMREVFPIILGMHSELTTEVNPNGIRELNFCGKKLQETASVGYTLDTLRKSMNDYGKRAKEAAENQGADFKALSHALRVTYQLERLVEDNNLIFPFRKDYANFLLDVKQGKHSFENVTSMLNENLETVTRKMDESNLPEKVDKNFVDDLVFNLTKFLWRN